MASRDDRPLPRREPPRLYLVTPEAADVASLSGLLTAALAGGDVAAVLLRLAAADERTLVNRIKALAPAVQGQGAALVIADHPEIVARAGADGAHLSGAAELQAAVSALKPERIAGCGSVTSRHDAMLAAEAGADYVMFGEPDEQGRRPPFDAVIERVAWWAEVFEIPCVGFAGSLAEAEALAAAGAEFVAVGDDMLADVRGPAAVVAELTRLLQAAEPVP